MNLSSTVESAELGAHGQNFYFKIRRDNGKISYDRCSYESVDDKSLSWVIPRKSMENKIQAVKG